MRTVAVGALAAALCACAAQQVYSPPLQMIVQVPVADVRAKPVAASGGYENDPLQETQIVKGEVVNVLERRGGWYRVECREQPEFTHSGRWEGYPGWVQADALQADMITTRLRAAPAPDSRDGRSRLLYHADRHLGNDYLWGGRSLHDSLNKDVATGVDCSGLVSWSFRQMGWIVPRDAHEQFMKAIPVDPRSLKPGDLIFLADVARPDKIVHVAIYRGEDRIIEAPSTGLKVRVIGFEERFGKPLSQIRAGDEVGGRIIRFGTFFMPIKVMPEDQ